MPLQRPILDDRSYEQLRDELIQRIPVYAPEWTDHNPSDPGITLIELFSFLGENILYRFNQIPDATYMEFLRLLQIPLYPAVPSQALGVLSLKENIKDVLVEKGTGVKAGDVDFETLNEVWVLPVSCLAVAKTLTEPPDANSEEAIFYQQAKLFLDPQTETAVPYKSELVPDESPGVPVDFDLTADNMLWVAVLAEDAASVGSVRQQLAEHKNAPLLLNIGFVPEYRLDSDEYIVSPEFTCRFRCPGEGVTSDSSPVQWSISTGEFDNNDTPQYRPLSIEYDTTEGLSREGVVRLRLPRDLAEMGNFRIDDPDRIGTGHLPPLLDDEELEERVIFWLRAFHLSQTAKEAQGQQAGLKENGFGKILYVGGNAVQLEQTCGAKPEFLGTGTGQPGQEYSLVHKYPLSGSLTLEIEEADGWHAWTEVDDFQASLENDHHYLLDPEAGTVRFGNGQQGMAPQIGRRIRLLGYRYGGGSRGNVPPDAVNKVPKVPGVEIRNPLAAYWGADAESIESALDRIPGELRRRDRAVTRGDFRELALMTPGANISRAECLPHYHPQLPNTDAAGVVSVFVWPQQDPAHPNAPLPDRNQLRTVCEWLDARRLVTTEVYVLPPKYRKVAVAVGLRVKPGYGIDAVRHWVEKVIRQYLSPLPPYGPEGQGWPLGHRVHGPELEAAALQVEGVDYLEDLQVAGWDQENNITTGTVMLEREEVVELIGVTVEVGPITVEPGQDLQPETSTKVGVPVPVLREEC